ncbi:peptide ligase PGM1-related protein [Streptomyces sp. NPDC057137]|uniref:preATP grasp domain-containing protein n=1 Tax=Streptomyces sp. NPDC057137 TaxID=3346030 RepID=UPI0036365441
MDLLTDEDFRGILFAMKRLIWLLRDGDAIVLPRPAPDAFLRYVAGHTGLDTGSVHIISPDADLLTHELLHSKEVLGRLQDIVTPDWEFRPYIYDRGAVTFARELGLHTDRARPFLGQGGAELFNSKVFFRAFAAGAGFSVPAGMPCRTVGDLKHIVGQLLAKTASVIVKRDRAVGGHGNFVVTTDPLLVVTGALSKTYLTDPRDLDAVVAAAGLARTHAPQGEVVVEEFLPDCQSVYVEVVCPEDGGEPSIVNSGELRTADDPPVLVGLEMPLQTIPDSSRKEFFAEALRMARMMRDLGYTGLASIDAVIASSGEIWFNEVNARMGGSTHLHHIAETLVGPDWADSHTLLSRFNVRSADLQKLLELLKANGLAWDPESRRGVVIASDDTEVSGNIEYVILAPSWAEGRTLESGLGEILAESAPPQV